MAAEHFPVRPMADGEQLKQFYIGRDIANVPKPAVVLDVNIIKRNCTTMLQAMKALNVGFRAHVKTHKVTLICISYYKNWLMLGSADFPIGSTTGR